MITYLRSISIVFFILSSSAVCIAQGLNNQGATLNISEGAVFSVHGNTTNNGTIINNGNFLITGFWMNNAVYEPGTGDFTLNSSGDQIINHNAQSFTRLVINGGGNKFFLADIEILESLDLSNGHLISENGARIIVADGASVREGNDQAHVVGPFYQRGTGEKLFPVGNGSMYLPVLLIGVTGSSPEIGVLLNEPNPINQVAANITAISTARAWEIDFTQAPGSSAFVELPLRDDNFIDNINNALIAFATQGSNSYTSIGNAASSGSTQSGFVRSANSINSSGYVAMAYQSNEEFIPPAPEVYNVVTPNGDDRHDFLKILNIEFHPNNSVHIFNRWGDELFRIQGYDNENRIFTGQANYNRKGDLPEGSYYYVIEDGRGNKYSGFFLLKR